MLHSNPMKGLVITQFQERWVKFPPGLVQGWGLKDFRRK
ncbi:hypothetical protein A2U01_0010525 [Trifolium medium]|uniref:Uncharacterized protein n=1 Tax=Trifolium medium TaxID=97028 RepID=A0A392MRC5_9FABA|nr:hypothetical protein [Trifolium medium]